MKKKIDTCKFVLKSDDALHAPLCTWFNIVPKWGDMPVNQKICSKCKNYEEKE